VERGFRVLSREGLVSEEQEAGYEHNEVVVIRSLQSQLADVVAQQSQGLVVLLQRKVPLAVVLRIGFCAVESGAGRCCCCDGRLLVDQIQRNVLPRRLCCRGAWKLVYGGQTEEFQGDTFDVFQGFGQNELPWSWADVMEMYARRRLVTVAGSAGLGTALADWSRLVAFDTACTTVTCEQTCIEG
jgi:hypothetical protein